MKRKLDDNDIPQPILISDRQAGTAPVTANVSFDSLNLSPRISQALAKAKYSAPTPIQAQVIPLIRAGKNVLARSKTGSGKTAAYILPCIQHVLASKIQTLKPRALTILILVPTHDLSDQVTRSFSALGEFCGKDLRVLDLKQKISEAVLTTKINQQPDIVVSTPGKLAQLLKTSTVSLASLELLIIDEADRVLSNEYRYEDDIAEIAAAILPSVQTCLISATLTTKVDEFKSAFGSDFAVVDIKDAEDDTPDISQYLVRCSEEDKFLLSFVTFKLKLVKGKTIVFVADVDRSYRLKLYLEQFGIKSCILNRELPINNRLHVVREFNKGVYDILIAADDEEVLGGVKHGKETVEEEEDDTEIPSTNEFGHGVQENSIEIQSKLRRAKSSRKADKDYSISRGIDFLQVSCVLNFDLPTSSRTYTHRIGRTARAGQTGMSLSFVVPPSLYGKDKYTTVSSARHDEKTVTKIIGRQTKVGKQIKDYTFNMAQVEGFRYRHSDALRTVTPGKIREARAREIKSELLKSERLAKHFEENPEDLKSLKHDLSSSAGIVKVQSHMKHVPEYLLPGGATRKTDGSGGFVSFNKDQRDGKRRGRNFGGKGRRGALGRKGRVDPLRSFGRKSAKK